MKFPGKIIVNDYNKILDKRVTFKFLHHFVLIVKYFEVNIDFSLSLVRMKYYEIRFINIEICLLTASHKHCLVLCLRYFLRI